MNWYFALSAASFGSGDHDWPSLIRVAVHSARKNTSLIPHLLWDGPEHPFLGEMRRLGVNVIPHQVSFRDDLVRFNADPIYVATTTGCFLRTEIPLLEAREPFVLYTDADVMFLRDPVPALQALRPAYFAAAPEFTFEDALNSGVMLLNVETMRGDYDRFRRFIRENLQIGLDQEMYRFYYADRFEKLPPQWNWKPYWGRNEDALIVHWHGIKPVVVRRLLDDPSATTLPVLQDLVERDPAGYRYYLDVFDGFARETGAGPAAPAKNQVPASARQSCAVVLVVKDESHDITAWLAWYHALGFDACIVFDDHSTDGTWEILENSATVQDIRLARTLGPRTLHYEHRQQECYQRAIASYRHEFAWLAFFDADEFLFLSEDSDVKSFLARFEQADAVAVNWCNYGSSAHLLRPSAPPFEAYTWHGAQHERINRHVKSFVRPAAVGPNWINVHCFDVPLDRYLLANGQPASWGEIPGIIDSDPDWRVAKLMHYQCRSMEQFVERVKKRPELADVPGLWYASDFRHVQDVRPRRLAPAVRAQMARLPARPSARAGDGINRNLIFDIGMSEGNDTAFYLAKGFEVAGVEPDVEAYLSLRRRFETELRAGGLKIFNGAADASAGRIVNFFRHDKHQGLSSLFNNRPEFSGGSFTTYPVVTIDWRELVARHGVPYYVKIDIEGNEGAFLEGLRGARPLPEFVSVECYRFDAAEALRNLGYRSFQLIDQNPPGGFALPPAQREGRAIAWDQWSHTSGPFGRDLPDNWVDFETLADLWRRALPEFARTWFDCHARLAPPT